MKILDVARCLGGRLLNKEGFRWQSKEEEYNIWLFRNSDKEFWQSLEGKMIFERLYILTQLGFAREDSKILREDTENHIFNSEFICIVVKEKTIVAYAAFKLWTWQGKSILYLSGIMVHPSYQGKGISSSLLRKIADYFGANFLTTRTQSPVMYESVKAACEEIWPSMTNKGCPSIFREIGEFVAKSKLNMQRYCANQMTEERTYGMYLYGAEPVSLNPDLEKWFKEKVNPQNGDSMIIVGSLKSSDQRLEAKLYSRLKKH